ncbi:hypothetical protein APASM_6994 [Actinosynnema pretiosum subsp. pretiosum]|nr:hypothetical protein APASM_6994 [Actinosynnema pretiosum subsp. pretiosum]
MPTFDSEHPRIRCTPRSRFPEERAPDPVLDRPRPRSPMPAGSTTPERAAALFSDPDPGPDAAKRITARLVWA